MSEHDGYVLWTIVGLTVATVLSRGFFPLFASRLELSDGLKRALRYAPVAALVAIVVPDLVLVQGVLTFNHPRFWGGLAAAVVLVLRPGMMLSISVGMAVYVLTKLMGLG